MTDRLFNGNDELAKSLEYYRQTCSSLQSKLSNCEEWLQVLVQDFLAGKEIVCKVECNHRNECPLDLKERSSICQTARLPDKVTVWYCSVLTKYSGVSFSISSKLVSNRTRAFCI